MPHEIEEEEEDPFSSFASIGCNDSSGLSNSVTPWKKNNKKNCKRKKTALMTNPDREMTRLAYSVIIADNFLGRSSSSNVISNILSSGITHLSLGSLEADLNLNVLQDCKQQLLGNNIQNPKLKSICWSGGFCGFVITLS